MLRSIRLYDLLTLLFIFSILIVSVSTVKAQVITYKDYRRNVMNEINSVRKEAGLAELENDDNLCQLAQLLANDREEKYPDDIPSSLFSESRYKDYLSGYSSYEAVGAFTNDMLIDLLKRTGEKDSFSDDRLIKQFLSPQGSESATMVPELTHACVAVSSGDVGYKPFAYFVGGVEKENAIASASKQSFALFGWIRSILVSFGLLKN